MPPKRTTRQNPGHEHESEDEAATASDGGESGNETINFAGPQLSPPPSAVVGVTSTTTSTERVMSTMMEMILHTQRMQEQTNKTLIETLRALPRHDPTGDFRTSTPSTTEMQRSSTAPAAVAAPAGNFTKCSARFNGKLRDAEKLEAFLDAVEVYKECADVSEQHALRGLSMLLEDDAALFWRGIKDNVTTWADAVARLRAMYGTQLPPYKIFREIFRNEQSESERADGFISRLRALIVKLPYKVSDAMQIDMIYGLLHRRIRKRLSRDTIISMDIFVEKVRATEDAIAETNKSSLLSSTPAAVKFVNKPATANEKSLTTCSTPTTSSVVTSNSNPILKRNRVRCAYCKVYGHTVENCRNLQGKSESTDCVHIQLYKDLKERQKNGQTKASLSLQQFLGFESGFTLDKESNTLAILCEDVVPVLAFDTREILIQWKVKVQHNLGSSKEFAAVIISSPPSANIRAGPVRLHACGPRLALCASRPPEVLALWDVKLLRRYGMVDKRFCVEGGSRCGKGEGLFVFAAEGGRELTDLLNVYSHDAQSRLSIASRSGSVLEKRFSDTSSCMDDCFHSSLRSVSPNWAGPASQTMHCLSDLDSSLDGEQEKFRRPTSLPRCSSCIGKISHLTRSSTMGTPGSIMSPVWTMDNIMEKRSDSDRASIYSRSSGSASEYSVPRSSCHLDKSFDSKRASPVACCTPTIPVKTGGVCQCWQQPKPCCCRKKSFSGPYENYDVPKTPMPLIQEHPVDSNNPANLYDTPKKLKCLLNGQACNCSHMTEAKPEDNQAENNNACDTSVNNNEVSIESHSNYVNVTPITKNPQVDYGNYANLDISTTLEKFESSLQILRSAGFSQEELDALEDIPEHDDDISTATTNTVHPSTDCCNDHMNYMHMEPLEISSSSNSNKNYSDNVSRISHVSDPTQHSDTVSTISTRRSSSADFTKRHDDDFGINSQICLTPTVLRKAPKSDRINDENFLKPLEIIEPSDKTFKVPESKSENIFITRFRDAVKIRRSSSVPSKSDKNRDSSSSNDSGVSTGSLKHHKGDFTDFEMPITSAKSTKKHMKCNKQMRRSMTPVHTPFMKSNSSDPLKNLTFHFEEVSALTKSNSCDVDTLTRRKKSHLETDLTARHSQLTNKSTSSGASDTSDYMESLSVSSFSSCDVSADRHAARPRSGKEYASIDRAALASVCDVGN